MRPEPDPTVIIWLEKQPLSTLFTTAITQSEILHGIALLPVGKRRKQLHGVALSIFKEELAGRVLPFDSEAAEAYAVMAANSQQSGRPISQFDAAIAAIALSRGAKLATRNVKDFEGCGVTLINPW